MIILVFCVGIKGVSYSLEYIGIIHGGLEGHLPPWVTDIRGVARILSRGFLYRLHVAQRNF